MAALSRALLAAAIWMASPSKADPLERWEPSISEASSRFSIPSEWIRRVMRAESGGRTVLRGEPIESPAGAMGLMQLMPATWQEMRAAEGLGTDPHDPRDNILAGTAYLRLLYDRYGYPGLFAAYNAGPGRYEKFLRAGRPLPRETVAYVAAVSREQRERVEGPVLRKAGVGRDSLFAFPVTRSVADPATPVLSPRAAQVLFVALAGGGGR